jgi:hypothetical protein
MEDPAATTQVPSASRGGEDRVRTAVRLTRHVATFALRYRWRELQLLAAPCALVILGNWWSPSGLPLPNAGLVPAMPMFVLVVLLVAVNVGLSQVAPEADQYLYPVAALLLAIGFLLAMFTQPALGWEWLASHSLGAAALLLLAAGLPIFTRRWRYAVGPGALSTKRNLILVAAAGLASLLVFTWERDIGAGIVVLAALLVPVYVAFGRGTWCAICAIVTMAVAFLWLDVIGGAIGMETMARPRVDMMAEAAEVLGVAGSLALLGCYAVITQRGFRIALVRPESWLRLTAAGLASALAMEALVATASWLQWLPATQVTAPFLMAGSGRVTIHFAMIGVLLGISAVPNSGRRTQARRGH